MLTVHGINPLHLQSIDNILNVHPVIAIAVYTYNVVKLLNTSYSIVDNVTMRHTYSDSPIGLNPSSQIHPIRIDFVADCKVGLLCDRVVAFRVSKADDRSSVMLNQLSSPSTGDPLNSKELLAELLDSPNTSRPLRNEVSVVTNGRKVTGRRCCSSRVYRRLCGDDVMLD